MSDYTEFYEHSIDIYQMAYSANEVSDQDVSTKSLLKSSVDCRFCFLTDAQKFKAGVHGTQNSAKIYMDKDTDVKVDQIVVYDSVEYRIVSIDDLEMTVYKLVVVEI